MLSTRNENEYHSDNYPLLKIVCVFVYDMLAYT